MKLLYGKPIAEKILNRLKNEIFQSSEKPGLAVILVGNDEASKIYVSLKEKTAKEIGINFFPHKLSEDVSEEEIFDLIEKLNADEKVHGIIVQLPLPKGFNSEKIISKIDPKKDADGFSKKGKLPAVFTRAIMLMLESSGEKLKNKKAVVVANSDEFGRAMSSMLEQKNIKAEYLLSKYISTNIDILKQADVVISAVGLKGIINGNMIKNGTVVVDGGIDKISGKVWGDMDFLSTEKKSGFLTPVPGGVGPVTIACLLENVFTAFKAQQKEK